MLVFKTQFDFSKPIHPKVFPVIESKVISNFNQNLGSVPASIGRDYVDTVALKISIIAKYVEIKITCSEISRFDLSVFQARCHIQKYI